MANTGYCVFGKLVRGFSILFYKPGFLGKVIPFKESWTFSEAFSSAFIQLFIDLRFDE